MSKKTGDDTRPIRAGIGEGFLQQIFGGKPFIHCAIELVKNCRDWGATLIVVLTNLDRQLLRIVDNGDGMDEANRDAFVSINLSTAKGPRQSGIFCTGTKQMLFSHASHVEVRTAPKDDPDHVYRFSFTTDAYEQLALTCGEITPERVRKTVETWPYEHRFGTEITYTLKDPRSRSILRGEALAGELSARLPVKFRDIVRVDEEMLPPKRLAAGTKPFQLVEQHGQLGSVAFELYHPERKRREEELRLTAVEVGEAPMANFFRVLPEELRMRFPDVYLLPEVCGTVSAAYLKEYANEDRTTLNPAVADDPRTPHFVRMLQQLAPAVMRDLGIRIRTDTEPDADEADIAEVEALFNRRYNPTGEGPRGPVGTEAEGGEPEESGGESREKPAVRLTYRREFEPDETIEIAATLRDDIAASGYRVDDLHWYTERSRARGVELADGRIRMVASELGHGVVRVELRGTPYSTVAHYEVVAQRLFRLSIPYAEIEIGSDLPVMGVNIDKLRGEVEWELSGPGQMDVQGGRVVYHASGEGHAVVTAFDAANPRTRATCDITVVAGKQRLICIRGHFFERSVYTAEGTVQFAKPVTMVSGGKVHRLVMNRSARGYRAAQSRGSLAQFLAQATALAFPTFARLDLREGGMRIEEFDPKDLPQFLQDCANEGYSIFEEILEDAPK